LSDPLAGNDPPSCGGVYDRVALQFDHARTRSLMEAPYLRAVLSTLSGRKDILDLGCGTGEPIARYFIDAGCTVTGIDIAPAMLALCRQRFPAMTWQAHDMRALELGRDFDAIIAWDSYFHLTPDDQRAMFAVFERHLAPGGTLLFTSGPRAGVAIGELFGHALYHASLDAEDYRALLASIDCTVLAHRVEDPACGAHTVWLARRGDGETRSPGPG